MQDQYAQFSRDAPVGSRPNPTESADIKHRVHQQLYHTRHGCDIGATILRRQSEADYPLLTSGWMPCAGCFYLWTLDSGNEWYTVPMHIPNSGLSRSSVGGSQ